MSGSIPKFLPFLREDVTYLRFSLSEKRQGNFHLFKSGGDGSEDIQELFDKYSLQLFILEKEPLKRMI